MKNYITFIFLLFSLFIAPVCSNADAQNVAGVGQVILAPVKSAATVHDSPDSTAKAKHAVKVKAVAFYDDAIMGHDLLSEAVRQLALQWQSIRKNSIYQNNNAEPAANDKVVLQIINHASSANAWDMRYVRSRIASLNSRVLINTSYNNMLAVKRDKVAIQYYQVMQHMHAYLHAMNRVLNNELEPSSITSYDAQYALNIEKSALVFQKSSSDSPVAVALNRNAHDLYSAIYAYKSILSYIDINPDIEHRFVWTDLFSVRYYIQFINDNPLSSSMNVYLNKIKLDVGGIVMFIVLFLVVLLIYPVLFKTIESYSRRCKEDDDAGCRRASIYNKLSRPLKVLFVFFDMDMATRALLYKTNAMDVTDNISFMAYVFLISWLVISFIDIFVSLEIERMHEKDVAMKRELFNLIVHVLKGITIIIATIIVLQRYGISVGAILSTLGIGGLAFALAAKDTISNLFGGVSIMFDDVYSIDDWVVIGESEGVVASIGLRSTTIRTFDNALITIPNAQVSTADVKNWHKRKIGRRIKMSIGVTYESNMDDIRNFVSDVRQMLIDHPGISSSGKKVPNRHMFTNVYDGKNLKGIKETQLVFMDKFSPYSIDILVYCFSRSIVWKEWLVVKEDVMYRIADLIEKNNLTFAYPTNTVVLRNDMSDIIDRQSDDTLRAA